MEISSPLEPNSRTNKMDGIIRIDKVVAEFDVWLDATLFPIPRMRVKVLESSPSDFMSFSNLRRRDAITREPEGTVGLGCSVDESLNDLLFRFVSDVKENLPSEGFLEDDFEWSAPEDF
jgi:hypothetical protein